MESKCCINVSIGELYDKFTILQIKQERIADTNKLIEVKKELAFLQLCITELNLEFTHLISELKTINEQLWDIEDKIREKERVQLFDAEFILLARQVYITNDKRHEIKNAINLQFNSVITDIKSYSKY